MDKQLSSLILGQPGPFRNSLYVLLQSIPNVATVDVNDTRQLRCEMQASPDFVVLDFASPDDVSVAAIRWIKANWSDTLLVILVQHKQQEHWASHAGADHILFKGLPADRLAEEVEKIVK